ncbi:MAG TPA: gliding motility lipoprotein GldH [Paludibacteraceae bacterium]|nr:gliding motility lipoprotein GldH [Paludibacteraceae bacterium]HQB68570.1 gliding motility lipoprotein GldH [Paludibacteraceae bacterium]
MKVKIILGFLLIIILTACSDTVFMECKELPTEGWHKDSLCVFEVPITETNATYQMQLIIRNDGSYPNQNLWLFVDHIKPDNSFARDTVQFFLADNFGRWTGSGVGSIFENVWIYRERIKYKETGTYKIRIAQGMRYEKLEGICDVGIKVIKTN